LLLWEVEYDKPSVKIIYFLVNIATTTEVGFGGILV